MRGRMAACALAVMAPVALAACGSSEKKGKETTVSVSETAQGNNLSIQGIPATIPAGPVTIKLTNSDKANGHDLQLAKVDGNHSQDEVVKLVGSNSDKPPVIPSWLHAAGGIGEANPGSTATSTQVLQPGTYYAIDDDSPGQGGPSNAPTFASRGAVAKFTVTGDKVKNDLPEQATTITAKDVGKDKFEFQTNGINGDKVQFVNDSKELHHVIAFKVGDGKTAADVKKFLASNGPPSGPPPFDTSPGVGGGTAVIDKGKLNTDISFKKPGQYVLVCFLTDRDGKGKPHFQEGLFKEVSVK